MKIYLESFGCSASLASAEVMRAAIKNLGHELLDPPSADLAEVYICNSCTVKYTTEQKILHKIRSMGEKNKEVIVSGCMPEVQLEDILHANPQAHILGVNAVLRLGDILSSIEQRKTYGLTGGERLEIQTIEPAGFLNVPRERSNSNIHICQISQGCNFACSYCIVKHARGKLRSFPPEEIVEDIRFAVADGCREIWLTSQDDSQYGMDTGLKLPELLCLISEVPGDFKVRVGMMNPFSVLPILDDLVDAFDSNKIFKLLHLPIQSASHSVLKEMNRLHKMDALDMIITKFRSRFDDISLFTDIIVGFCGETEEDFKETVEWIKKYRPEKVNISRYSPRPHTKAFSFRNLDSRLSVQRSHELHRVCEKIKLESKREMIGWKGRAFVSKYTELGDVLTRTDSYRPVVISGSNLSPGQYVNVEIVAAKPGYFLGKLIS
jgi:threonylcarbamoyladenosine tRNA methylthiotransferase CDKAL1